MKLDENGIPTLFNCAYCNDVKVLPGYNSFKARHEDLMAEWDYTKNNDLGYDPDLISDANIRYVSWLCSTCGMKYTDFVKNRIFDKENGIISCPYCSGRKALPGVTSFKALHVMVGDGKKFIIFKKMNKITSELKHYHRQTKKTGGIQSFLFIRGFYKGNTLWRT